MNAGEVRLIPLVGVPEVSEGDDLAASFVEALGPDAFEDHDVLVVTQKVVSKAEGRTLPLEQKQAAIISESKRILRRTPGGMVISETHHGFVCANAGVDESNVDVGHVVLLPVDPDASARRMRARLKHMVGKDIAVIVSDTFGRAWRVGQTDVAIGVAGMDPFIDHRGSRDTQGRELTATRIAIADELAGAAEMVMGKAEGICAAVIRGARVTAGRGSARQLVRAPADDLFR